ncbi:MAG: flagellar M-ring protein FliF [Desulfobacteraceae bacterium]|nr:MAG: flagellar M-ring protein FliF [Desulfobacteraceae bacterium]
MAEENKNFFLQLLQVFKEIPTGRKISFIVTAALLITGFAVLIYWANRPNYQALFTNLEAADASKIIDKLNEKKIPFLLKESGSAIFVPDDMVYQLRLEMASAGIPKGQNVGFEIFDNVGFGTTEFVQKLKYLQALQGELARTIMEFDSIAQARVHIVAVGDSLFAEPEKPATASVVLRMKQGRFLDPLQLQGIINLVSCAVEGLKPQNVSVVDMAGGLLSKGHDENDVGGLTQTQLDYRQKVERTLESRIQTLLEPVIGVNKVIARVAAEVDFGQVNTLEEKYDPASVTVRSEQRQKETAKGSKSLPSGSPDLQTQLLPENQTGAGSAESAKNYEKENAVINYEINKINRQTKSAVGDIKRLSAAVIIDGPYTAEKGADNKTIQKFTPRSKRDMKNFEDVIKKAIGFSEERGDQVNVSNIAFTLNDETAALAEAGRAPYQDYLKKYGKPVFNIALVLIFLLIIVRPFKRWLSQSTEYLSTRTLSGGAHAAALSAGMDEAASGKQSKEKLLEMTRNSPDMAADIIKNWISEGRG